VGLGGRGIHSEDGGCNVDRNDWTASKYDATKIHSSNCCGRTA